MKKTPFKKRNKYGANRRYSKLLDRTFHSKAECRYAEHLFTKQQNGEITDLSFQKHVKLKINDVIVTTMIVDFYYFDNTVGDWVYDEFKGFATDKWKHSVKLWAQLGPGMYRITRASRNRLIPYTFEEIWPVGYKAGESQCP